MRNRAEMKTMATLARTLLLMAAALAAGCVESEHEHPGDRTAFKDGFGTGLSKWLLCGAAPPFVEPSGGSGQRLAFGPGEGEIITIRDFSLHSKLFAWTMSAEFSSLSSAFRGGITASLGCNGAAVDTLVAGFNVPAGEDLVELVLDDVVIDSVPVSFAGGGSVRLVLVTLGDDSVRYIVDDVSVMTGTSPSLMGGPYRLTFQTHSDGGSGSGRAWVDRVRVVRLGY